MMLTRLFRSIFGSYKDENRISFYKLYSSLRNWDRTKTYPSVHQLPDSIIFPDEFWQKVISLYKDTLSDGLERAISVFWADGDLILSSVVKGNANSVTPRNNVKVSYTASIHKGYVKKEVYVDDKLYSKREVYHKKIPQKLEVVYLFNMHTHPPHHQADGRTLYSFFSLQDLHSLLGSGAVVTGMISDRLWLLIRTVNTPKQLVNFEEREISVESLNDRLHMGVYSGDFNGSVKRLVPQVGE